MRHIKKQVIPGLKNAKQQKRKVVLIAVRKEELIVDMKKERLKCEKDVGSGQNMLIKELQAGRWMTWFTETTPTISTSIPNITKQNPENLLKPSNFHVTQVYMAQVIFKDSLYWELWKTVLKISYNMFRIIKSYCRLSCFRKVLHFQHDLQNGFVITVSFRSCYYWK